MALGLDNIISRLSRIFSTRQCAKCDVQLRCDELVMRARDLIFHLHCFCCALCQLPLSPGDTAAVQGGQLYCGEHVDHHLEEQRSLEMSPHSFYCASPQKGRPRKRKCSPHTPSSIGLTLTHPSLLLLDQSNVTESLERNSRGAEMDQGTELRLGEISQFLLSGLRV